MIIEGNIIKIAGPVIIADGMRGAQMLEMVRPLLSKYMKKQPVFNRVK